MRIRSATSGRRVRRSAAVAAAAALSLALVACGGGGGASGDGTITFYTDKASWKPQFTKVSDASKKSIETELKFTGYSNAEQYSAFIRQSFRTNKKPDLFTWHTGKELEDLAGQGLLEPTTKIWDKAVKDGNVPAEMKPYFTVKGEQYCVPMNAAYWVMYYNKPLFAKYKIQEPKTWPDLMKAADTLKKNGVTPFHQDSVLFQFVWFQTLLAGTDPQLYDDLSTGKAKYTDPRVVKVMNQWGDMIDKKYFIAPGTKTTPEELLKGGKVGMINFGTFLSGQLNAVGMKSGKDYDFFAVPNVNPSLQKTVLPFETGPMCTAKGSKNSKGALKFDEWWMTPKAQTAWANARGDVSFNPKAKVNDSSLAELNKTATGSDYQLVNRYYEATPTPILTTALAGFGKFVSKGGDPMPILKDIQAEADTYWKSKK